MPFDGLGFPIDDRVSKIDLISLPPPINGARQSSRLATAVTASEVR
jgi:hypothetical protein